jgi:hypothetical protein
MAYADDVYIIAVSPSVVTNQKLPASAHEHCEHFAHSSGYSFSVQKYQLLHVCRIAELKSVEPMSKYIPEFPDPKLPAREMDVLGVQFCVNRRGNSTWDRHYEKVKAKVRGLSTAFRRLVHPSWGLAVPDACKVLTTVTRASIAHGSQAFWTADDDFLDEIHHESGYDDDSDLEDDDDKDEDDHDPLESEPWKPSRTSAIDSYMQNSPSQSLRQKFEARQNDFLRPAAGAPRRTIALVLQKEMNIESVNVFMGRARISALANLVDTPEGGTISKARQRVEHYAHGLRHKFREVASIPQEAQDPVDAVAKGAQQSFNDSSKCVPKRFDDGPMDVFTGARIEMHTGALILEEDR